MKRSTLENIRSYLNGDDTVDLSILREEVNAEWNRLFAKAQANRETYDEAKALALSLLSDKPCTVKQVFEAGGDRWPQGFTANKLQYAFLHYWNDEIVKHDNGKSANTYTVK